MRDKPNIFNIPANYHFFRSLFNWMDQSFTKEEIPKIKIFLPNQRSCREFRQLFLKQEEDSFLPNIKAISDISYEDFFDFLPNDEAKTAIKELSQIKILSKTDYLFFLSKEIKKLSIFGQNLEFEQAFKIAVNLYSLFDDIEREEIDLKQLDEIDDSNLSQHRLLTLDFLKNFHIQIKNSLLKEDILFATSAQNLLIQKFIYLLNKFGSKTPLIIAGSTGSVSFSKKLIKEISQKNYVILHGADEQSQEIESHPQFFLSNLVKFLEIDKKSIAKISENEFSLSDEVRQELIGLLMIPSSEATKWQDLSKYLDISKAKQDLEANFQLIEAKNELEEAKIIALALQEALKSKKTAAVISNNDKLTNLLHLEISNLGLPFNNSKNLNVFNSKLITFLLLILELLEDDFNSHNLLAILKNPLCIYSKNNDLVDFEIKILRQERNKIGIEGILESLKKHDNLYDFFKKFITDINFSKLTPATTLADSISNLIKIAENLSSKVWDKLLEEEPAQIELFEFFTKLQKQKDIIISPNNLLATLKTLLSQVSYFEKSDSEAPIQILSTIEARLLNYDLVIIASLNQGNFPESESENWLGKKIKKDLKIDRTLKKLGQSAYDFCNYLSNKSVILSHCKSRNNAILLESPFLLKFKTICVKIGANLDSGERYFSLLKQQNNIKSKKISPPNPKPESDLRPKRISITEISKLLSNPYNIYAKKVLQLKELKKIDFEAGYSEFGSFVHQALEEFIKSDNKDDFLKKAEVLFAEYFLSHEAKLIWWPKFENIFAEFIEENQKFTNLKNKTEITVESAIEGIILKGKIDRIITNDDDSIGIFDYKTGQPPSKKAVTSGIDPQLTIAALMLNERISSLNYWKLSSSSLSEIKVICNKDEELQILIAAAKSGLEKLFKHFSNEENGYLATENNIHSDYKNLIRSEEWGNNAL